MTYRVVVTREGDSWLADIPEVPGAHTFARSLAGLEKSAREVVILMDGLEDNADIDLDFDYQIEDSLLATAIEIGRERTAPNERDRRLQTETARTAHDLRSNGISVRDSARLLALTPGRVSQLVND